MEKVEEKDRDREELQILNRVITRHEAVVIVWDIDESLRFTASFVSENIDAYGYSPEELEGGKMSWEELISKKDRRGASQEFQYQIMNGGTRYQQEYRLQKKNGEQVWVRTDNVLIRDKAKQTLRLEVLIYNIDEIKGHEQRILEQQIALNEEVYKYVDVLDHYDTIRERLTEFIKDQQIELLQNAFSDVFAIHTAIVGLDFHFYTHMTGPKEDEGIFYDIAEIKNFHEAFDDLNHSFARGERHQIIVMNNPHIKVSGVPINYRGEHIATWILCCLVEKSTTEIIKISGFMKIMANTMSDYYSNHMGKQTEKGFALERFHMKQVMNAKNVLLTIYEELLKEKDLEDKIISILRQAVEYIGANRGAIYWKVENTIYSRCEFEWNKKEQFDGEVPNQAFSIKALPYPADIFKDGIAIMNSIHLEPQYRDTYADLCCKAAVLLELSITGKRGFLTFIETEEDRIFTEEEVTFLKEVKKIIEKVLLKSE